MNIILYLTLIGLVFTAPIEKDAIETDVTGARLARPWMGDNFEGDILLKNRTVGYKAFPQSDTVYGLKKWPNGVVPYVFEGYNDQEKAAIKKAMDMISSVSCVRFVPRTNQKDYVKIWKIKDGQCTSYVGVVGGAQDLSLGKGCVDPGTAAHELMHAIGFNHEQTRPDRDQYINVYYQNMMPGRSSQFDKIQGKTPKKPYDVKSIMHYESLAFSVDPYNPQKDTMRLKNLDRIPRPQVLTEIDKASIRELYNC